MASAAAQPTRAQLRRCDMAMARMLRARSHEPGAERILAEGFLGRMPLGLLAAPENLGKNLGRWFRRPPYPSPLCKPKFFLPFLSSRAIWPSNDEVSTALVANWKEIRQEFHAAMEVAASADVNTRGLTTQGSWQKVPLYSHGQPHEENLARCPTTAATLSPLPLCRALGMAYFSKMAGGSVVRPHFGPTNARVRYHLGLDVPDGNIYLAVEDGLYRWSEGRTLVFSDAYLHAVHHQEEEARGVLVVDVYHPELTLPERRLLEDLERLHRMHFPAEYERALPH